MAHLGQFSAVREAEFQDGFHVRLDAGEQVELARNATPSQAPPTTAWHLPVGEAAAAVGVRLLWTRRRTRAPAAARHARGGMKQTHDLACRRALRICMISSRGGCDGRDNT